MVARRPRLSAREARGYAEERFARYVREAKEMVYDAEGRANDGDWREAAIKLHAAIATLAAAAGTAQELTLLYTLTEE